MNMTTLYFLIDISGVPTIPLVFLLKRYPFLHNSFETIVSNLETALILLIVLLLCSEVMISAMTIPPSTHKIYIIIYPLHEPLIFTLSWISHHNSKNILTVLFSPYILFISKPSTYKGDVKHATVIFKFGHHI